MPRYSEQFKRDAVALYENNEDLSLHAASAELGVNRSSLFSWLQQYGTGKRARTKAMRDNAKETTDSERIRQLEKENAKLREERDILRKAYNSLNHLWRSEMLFVYLNPPAGVLAPERIKSTTNSLEGGINAQLKLLARTHRGRSGERQRRMLDWWLYLKTELPDDPVRIARQSDWGQGQLAKVSTLTQTENQADHETGRPALYDNAIDTDYTHSIGIQKGQI